MGDRWNAIWNLVKPKSIPYIRRSATAHAAQAKQQPCPQGSCRHVTLHSHRSLLLISRKQLLLTEKSSIFAR